MVVQKIVEKITDNSELELKKIRKEIVKEKDKEGDEK
jgi:hypothetical protein